MEWGKREGRDHLLGQGPRSNNQLFLLHLFPLSSLLTEFSAAPKSLLFILKHGAIPLSPSVPNSLLGLKHDSLKTLFNRGQHFASRTSKREKVQA